MELIKCLREAILRLEGSATSTQRRTATNTPPVRGTGADDQLGVSVGRRSATGLRMGGVQANSDIAEMYSPPRCTAMAAEMGLKPGEAMDLTTGWGFTLERHRSAAREYMKRMQPKLVVGTPSRVHHVLKPTQPLEEALECRTRGEIGGG